MAKATEEQKLQLIAKISTATDRRKWDGDKLQLWLSDEAFDDRLAAFINGWQAPEPQPLTEFVIQLSTLPTPKFPDWSRGRILNGVVEPKTLDLTKLSTDAWFHPNQTGSQTRPTGHQILATLVASYKAGKDEAGKTYQANPADLINSHFGLRELTWLEQNWKTLPKAFRDWAKGKLLYGWADVVRRGNGYLNVPYLYCHVETPYVLWYLLGDVWRDVGPALREQVSSQG